MVPIVLDENVSLDLARVLRKGGYEVLAVVETASRGISDAEVWKEVKRRNGILITRDYHFTNPSRFPPQDVFSIIYIRQGNLTSQQEVRLVEGFLSGNPEDTFHGRLVTLSPFSVTLR